METIGIIIALLGGVFAFASALALAFAREESSDVSAWQWGDVFLLGGALSFVRGLIRGISDGFTNRKSTTFVQTIVFFASVTIAIVGIIIIS
jgi:hypothetical protein